MGTWGTGLYSNDFACDIRGDYIDKLKRGKTNDEATQELITATVILWEMLRKNRYFGLP